MQSVLVVGLAIAVGSTAGCKKQAGEFAPGPSAPTSTADQDALWALAPDGAKFGIVASARGVAMVERGVVAVTALLDSAPELAPLSRQLAEALSRGTGSSKLTLAEFGLTPDKGFALFVLDNGASVSVLPVGDRDKFLAKAHGTKGSDHDMLDGNTCKMLDGRYVCVSHTDLFAKLGRTGLSAALRAAGARGDLELAGRELGGPHGPSAAAVARLDRGTIALRGTLAGVSHNVTDMIGTPGRPRAGAESAAGFGVLDAAPFLAKMPPTPLTPQLTLADLARAISGPLTLVLPAGVFGGDVRIPLRDPAPAKVVVEHCTSVPPLAQAGATLDGGICRVPVPSMGLTAEVRVEGNELRIGNRVAGTPVALVPSALAGELARGEWSIALFGRGSFLGLAGMAGVPQLIQSLPAEARMVVRMLPLLNELGAGVRKDGETLHFVFGIRTAWANPDVIVQKLLAVSLDQMLSGQATSIAASIASEAPSSSFAEDVKAGVSGMVGLSTPIGMVAAVATPMVVDFMKRSRKSD